MMTGELDDHLFATDCLQFFGAPRPVSNIDCESSAEWEPELGQGPGYRPSDDSQAGMPLADIVE
jgi:hypothetical protein